MYDVGRAQLRSCAEGEGASPIRGFGAKVATRVPARCGDTDASIYSESRSSHVAACEPQGGFRTAVTDRTTPTASAAAHGSGGLRGPRVLQDPFIAPQYDNSVGFLSLPFIRYHRALAAVVSPWPSRVLSARAHARAHAPEARRHCLATRAYRMQRMPRCSTNQPGVRVTTQERARGAGRDIDDTMSGLNAAATRCARTRLGFVGFGHEQ